ncbi:F-box domain-containing protein [Colletotrichum higginsianum IMI 349063]|uniref:F-box domain-containing protein n=1 Tax=Colletotrichum higginsianum (strain IMI 349063) TaxID=759273 RepID=A0A1B7YG88_COLHI|nr:F-box domain-containing protein [Colletotrichum higginsianum IMI 349063]OBR10808.1 F-box domain-containing protein [Colletotrichum higginsianum IMI 349063]
MKLRSKTTYSLDDVNSNLHWATLPAEIRLMILKELEGGNGRHDFSCWTRVSWEWQAFFEPQNFQDLKLQFPGFDIDDLNSIVYGYRRNLVKKISLHVRTEEYDTTNKFDEPETKDTIKANNKLFSQALKKMFCSLSTWVHDSSTGGIGFKLSASSPSDVDHPWKHRLEPTQYDRSRIHSLNSKRRLLGNLLDLSSGSLKLAQVPIIRCFSVNQHCYRSLSRAALAKILSSLCCLQSINYEPWHAIGRTGHFPRDEAIIMLLERVSEYATVKSVHLWEAQSPMHRNPRFLRSVNDGLILAAVNASYNLRYFTLCHAIDAKDFFQNVSRDVSGEPAEASSGLRGWPALSHLALTTHIGDLTSSPTTLKRLLLEASQAAMRMPQLEVMEIWAPGAGEGFIFRYEVRKDLALLTVVASWQLALSKEVVKSWKIVASHWAPREFTHQMRLAGSETTTSSSPFAYCRKLRLRKLLREWR